MVISHTILKKLKRSIARKQRTFTGEELGLLVVEYLERSDRPPDDPVEGLVDRFQFPTNPHSTVDFFHEAVRKRPHLRLQTKRELEVTPEGAVVVKEIPVHGGEGPVPPSEARLMLAWNQCFVLISRGLLDRARRCAKEDCRKWFYARFRHAVFHHEACRVAVENANPEYRERRREHMRKIREQAARKKGKKS